MGKKNLIISSLKNEENDDECSENIYPRVFDNFDVMKEVSEIIEKERENNES